MLQQKWIRNMNLLTLACKLSPVRKSIKPFIIHEAGVSPGWTRAVTTIAFFFCVITKWKPQQLQYIILKLKREDTNKCSTQALTYGIYYYYVIWEMITYSGRTSSFHLQDRKEETGKSYRFSVKTDNKSQGISQIRTAVLPNH